ncbi:SDR family NAD(P)-dependent oxidoreductase [Chitinophaga nivalis]|uniref:SDR family NAD(P)-dependent oxidoreductase n=1 Tax=Chitinophaga nivalis TaxID=2991709 RepID=A0ABT3IIV4_9BACT|nr:SDR family NAD(P)-dependent oxidoreductase [Chitinophaga nivalis]MCW3466423.1 SDR family NAD(P)-dependent oxidoreductase [Chitinophaga nivalis]MCW3483886.1 SDR family NAD(P)-dependent oxidoreductase [Chitinophaga nivalis]
MKQLPPMNQQIPALLLQPHWRIAGGYAKDIVTGRDVCRLVISCQLPAAVITFLQQELPAAVCHCWQMDQESMAQAYEACTIELMLAVQSALNSHKTGDILLQVLVPSHSVFMGLSGLLSTATQEAPRLKGQVIGVPVDATAESYLHWVETGKHLPVAALQAAEQQLQVVSWEEYIPSGVPPHPWRPAGVYLITGGMGGLGLIWAKEIISRQPSAKVILTGRSSLTTTSQQLLSVLQQQGEVVYVAADISDKTAVTALISNIRITYGDITGIMHAAGIIRDSYLLRKTETACREVLQPKTSGLLYLDEATSHMHLDFFALFSSVSAVAGNIGQADYAAANAFMDSYAGYRNSLVKKGIRTGKTLSVNWPLWKDGGMQIDDSLIAHVKELTGIIPLETSVGMDAFYIAYTQEASQVMVLPGDIPTIRKQFIPVLMKAPLSENVAVNDGLDLTLLKEKTRQHLTVLFADVTRLSPEEIHHGTPLEKYGIDSLMINQLNKKLETVLGEISKTLFFEYHTLQLLADYLATAYTDKCIKWTGYEGVPVNGKTTDTSAITAEDFPVLTSFGEEIATVSKKFDNIYEPIAIIGLTGRYPGAPRVTDFWENLQAGKDCITTLPEDRWALEGFFNPDKQAAAAHNQSYSKWGGFLEGYADFDPLFFNIAPKEALNIDPQERLFIQSCWEVLEDAGYTRDALTEKHQGAVGVFAGITKTGYDLYGPELWKTQPEVFPHTAFASVANRVSYLFGFKGPSMPVDTMCSSSLTAIHEACLHIQTNQCDVAIAGGVNLYLHPACYIALCSMQMLSVDGKCKSFGENGNGFVPGEGVGTILLKRLSAAEADGDHIYGVIKGSAINHGGKTNGYTVPNPVSQGQLISTALQQAGISARNISYIEAHGTGTDLGDPIEVAGLVQAFRKDTDQQQYCLLGSAKSNIGHLEAAAGIAGVTKILLQMKAQSIVASLHATTLNPNINFADTPFVVAQQPAPWRRPVVTENGIFQEYPRTAGISSFGAGGANAHVILEEYTPAPVAAIPVDETHPAIFLLSAKNSERLQVYARQLYHALSEPALANRLADVAFTLQTGREAMEERLAIIAATAESLQEQLLAFLEPSAGNTTHIFQGRIKGRKNITHQEPDATISTWLEQKNYPALLTKWIEGAVIDWHQLYTTALPRRISLPTYPFAAERYWLPDQLVPAQPAAVAVLHPLLHRNTSTLTVQKFSSGFSGEEFFLRDHVVSKQRMLPGVAYLEMVREAIVQSTGEQTGVLLKNVVWTRPVIATGTNVTVHVSLFDTENGEIDYEIYSEDSTGEVVIHSQGTVSAGNEWGAGKVDLAGWRAGLAPLAVTRCYKLFDKAGLSYGPAHQTIKEIYSNRERVLARLAVQGDDGHEAYQLHPGLMDGALQATIGLLLDTEEDMPIQPMLPFALEEVKVYRSAGAAAWAAIRYSPGSTAASNVQRLDVTLCDDAGNICVEMKGYSSRVFGTSPANVTAPLLLTPAWVTPDITTGHTFAARIALVCCEQETDYKKIVAALPGVACSFFPLEEGDPANGFTRLAVTLFRHIQELLPTIAKEGLLLQLLLCETAPAAYRNGLLGLLKTIALEYPGIKVQLINLHPGSEEQLPALSQLSEQYIRIQQHQVTALHWQETTLPEAVAVPWRSDGVYLITGGMGGLGVVFAREILRAAPGAVVILSGRSALNEQGTQVLTDLQLLGTAHYIAADISQAAMVNGLMADIRARYGNLHGILHAAGVLRDSVILRKTTTELSEVLAPKVSGLVLLDEATKEMDLEVFLLFSSLSAVLGNVGQADYAMANNFMDGYAAYRNNLVQAGRRKGHTLSVNWPLWQDGGMQIPESLVKLERERTGVIPLQTTTAMQALYGMLALQLQQGIIIEGNVSKIKEKVVVGLNNRTPVKKERREKVADDKWLEEIKTILKQTVATLLKVNIDHIDEEAELSEYGFDSISFTQLANNLNHIFDLQLTPAVFFEYVTLGELAVHLVAAYPEELAKKFSGQDNETIAATPLAEDIAVTPVRKKRHRLVAGKSPADLPVEKEDGSLAIIGISGQFPMAEDLAALWQHLEAGKDCIGEIPEDRWSWKDFYGNPEETANRTNIKWGGFISDIAAFDPLFFGISPREAAFMDPQQRLLMTHVWKAIEDAGYAAQSLSGSKTGIFVATACSGYNTLIAQEGVAIEGYSSTGMAPSVGPNRMSYFLNFHGPSEPVETACSSSLIAIHRAMEAINAGSCEMAVVGGINTILTPEAHISFNKAGMLCEDGRCKTFSDKANGYVRSEGVGMIFLKKLSAAKRDQDHIYAIVRGTAENHGGKANSLTAPNPKAQTELLKTAYQKAGISPDTVSYMEAHGTGTELGDPIEINALKAAFKDLYQAADITYSGVPHCGIGAVKTNIGHTELAAGIAGVLKVVLQLQHQTLVKTLHCDTINPYIQLQGNPFYIVQEKQPWKRLKDSYGAEIPRRAGVSSFGFGGANAHVILEEYIAEVPAAIPVDATHPAIFVLSAKNEQALKARAAQLLEVVSTAAFRGQLADVAYTLQVGRDMMEERLAIVADSAYSLQQQLEAYLRDPAAATGVLQGKVKRGRQPVVQEIGEEAMNQYLTAKNYLPLLTGWVNGGTFDWNRLYTTGKPRRISLPVYPFSKERYWLPGPIKPATLHGARTGEVAQLHPLLHRNTSLLSSQRFTSVFTGEEPFLRDHVVNGLRILPGVATLELAREAALQSVGGETAAKGVLLKEVVWARPVIVSDTPATVHIRLHETAEQVIRYEIYSEALPDAPVYSQGILSTGNVWEQTTIDLPALRASLASSPLSAAHCYALFREAGLDYGPSHQTIKEIYGHTHAVLAKLTWTDAPHNEACLLHPGLLDGALQAAIGLLSDTTMTPTARVPFLLEEVRVHQPVTATVWAYVRYSEGSTPADPVQRLDIHVYDEQGVVLVEMNGYCSRTLEAKTPVKAAATGQLLLTPAWVKPVHTVSVPASRIALVCCEQEADYKKITAALPDTSCYYFQLSGGDRAGRFTTLAVTLLQQLQTLLTAMNKENTLLQLLVCEHTANSAFSGLSGLLKTLSQEYPGIRVQLIEMQPGQEEKLAAVSALGEQHIRLSGEEVTVLNWMAVAAPEVVSVPWKKGGVYLITGGTGGLGIVFAREIITTTPGATVVLTGRSPLPAEEKELQSLLSSGAVHYIQADISSKSAVVKLFSDIIDRYGAINGILHAAGVLRDSLIVQKTVAELTAVFAAKVNGLVHLDIASSDLALDFFLLFSSAAAVLGNSGQADYAMANSFMDSYAGYRNRLVERGARKGHTIAINWPLWKEGGMQLPPAVVQLQQERTGIVPLQTATAMKALYGLMALQVEQGVVLEGDVARLAQFLPVATPVSVPEQEVQQLLMDIITEAVAGLLNVPALELDITAEFLDYGLERVSVDVITKKILTVAGIEVTPGAFFRYGTIQEAVAQLAGKYKQPDIAVAAVPVIPVADIAPVVVVPQSNTVLPPSDIVSPDLDKSIHYFRKMFAAVIRLPLHQLDGEVPMEQYGIDSFMVLKLTAELEKIFGPLSKTLFFEYQTIAALAAYFVASHGAKMQELTGTAILSPAPVVPATPAVITPRRIAPLPARQPAVSPAAQTAEEDVIAIIGVAGKYPGADNIVEFWNNLRTGKDSITEIPYERWDHSLFYDPDKTKPGKTYSKWGGFINGVDEFDPLFFNISPREAELIDPQERLFLQCAMATLEDAGYTRQKLSAYNGNGLPGNVGVFAGVMYSEYQLYGAQETIQGRPLAIPGNPSSIANRVSYYCNFHGPSLTVDTMCSSSLTAIHFACQSIQRGDCELALAGGVNVSVHPNKYLMLGQGRFVSSKGRCESFGEGGDGYVPGEGVGAVLLKPLSKAVADGDHIYGVIKSSAVNHGGKTNGFAVPNPVAQASVIGHAFRRSGIDPASISYIEAHGTGTSLGDPIEITGLKKAFEAFTAAKQFCAIGSAKSNIGHCESAAGIAGLTKVLLQLQHRQLVPSLHSQQLNSHIDFENSPFVVQQTLATWKRPVLTTQGVTRELPLRAGLSSFGAGGSNAHLVIEEYSMPEKALPVSTSSAPYLLVFSARTQERLTVVVQRFLHYLQTAHTAPLADIAFTLQTGREGLEERLGILVTDIPSAISILTAYLSGETAEENVFSGSIREDKDSLWLMQDEDFRKAAIDSCIQKGKYDRLLALWAKGYDLNWALLYPDGFPSKVSLPTYPFARERYWFRQPAPARTTATALLQKQWVPVSLTAVRPHSQQVVILVTASGRELGAAIQAQLAQSIVAEVSQVETLPIATGGVIDLTGYGCDDTDLSWLGAVQHLIETGPRSGMRFLGVTSDLENYKHTAVATTGALHAGLYRLLGAEYKYISSCHLDVLSGLPVDLLATAVIRAFQWEGEATSLCFREGQYQECVLDTAAPAAPRTVRFTDKDVLVVTGGTRGIGYLCAQHFITRYGVRHVLLTGREQLPPRAEWEQHIAMDGRYTSKLRNLLLLTAGGVTVEAVSVDLTSAAAITALVTNVHADGKQIGGVLHAAGLIDAETPAFIRKTAAGIAQVLSPKVAGLQALYTALQHEPLQCFLLFSSVSAQIPALGSGQSDYAMANAYMDYFAQCHGPLLQSIQWPSWKETGIGEVKSMTYTRTGLTTLSNQTGLDLLDEVLAQHIGPVVMPAVFVPGEWQPAKLLRKEAALPAATAAVPVTFIPPAVPANTTGNTTGWLTNIFTKELKIDPDRFDTQRSFPDYGVDSVLLSQILGHINRALGEQLDPSVLLEHTTVAALSRWLEKQYAKQLAAVLVPAAQGIPVPAVVAPVIMPDVQAIPLADPVVPATAAVTAVPLVQTSLQDDIAVVGYSCRFPGADNIAAYWKLLSAGQSAIKRVPAERWGYENNFHAGLINRLGHFDARYFSLPEEDARAMDPQALLLMEESLSVCYHAGYEKDALKGAAIGVYIGGRSQHHPESDVLAATKNPIVAVGPNYLATNISRFFDFRGPSLVVDTACSSALVGMSLAIQALKGGDITGALVGGVSLLHTDKAHQLFSQRNLLSTDGVFHIFDQRAGGVVLGEGAGMVLLKKVSQAMADGDKIYAVIKGIAVNNDGKTAGPATPNMQAQQAVMEQALLRSGKTAVEVGYIEANGSGSEVTDLLELKAMMGVYGAHAGASCGVGSVKPNIGHPLCAEGIAGFIKLLLMLEHEQEVPFLSGQQGLQHFDMAASPFRLNRQLQPLTTDTVALSSFADGGTNAHVILTKAGQLLNGYQARRAPLALPALQPLDLRKKKPLIPAAFKTIEHGHPSIPVPQQNGKKHSFWKQTI